MTGSHELLIGKAEFGQVKALEELMKQQNPRKGTGTQFNLSLKIHCGKCGATFLRKVTSGKVYWVCRNPMRSTSGTAFCGHSAAEKYAFCSDGESEYLTEQHRGRFQSQPSLTEFNPILFKKTIKQMLLEPDGTAHLKLINNQIIR